MRDVPDSTHVLCGISGMSVTPSETHSMPFPMSWTCSSDPIAQAPRISRRVRTYYPGKSRIVELSLYSSQNRIKFDSGFMSRPHPSLVFLNAPGGEPFERFAILIHGRSVYQSITKMARIGSAATATGSFLLGTAGVHQIIIKFSQHHRKTHQN